MANQDKLPQRSSKKLAIPDNVSRPPDDEKPDLLASFAEPEKHQELLSLQQIQENMARAFFAHAPVEDLPSWALPVEAQQKEQIVRDSAEKAKAEKLLESTTLIENGKVEFTQKCSEIEKKEQVLRAQFLASQGTPPASFSSEKQDIEQRAAMIEQRFVDLQKSIRSVEQVLNDTITSTQKKGDE